MGAANLERLLHACADKLNGPPYYPFLQEEDERPAYAVLTALRRDLLQASFLTQWAERLAQSDGVPWPSDTFDTSEQTNRLHNLKAFVRSLYFQL